MKKPGARPKPSPRVNTYSVILERVFRLSYKKGSKDVRFNREAITTAAKDLGVPPPKNLGDVVYSHRYRVPLPDSIRQCCPAGAEWIIWPVGRGLYSFRAVRSAQIVPAVQRAVTKVPDATPGIIVLYARVEEQALLAKLRYNRLLDVFTGCVCYSLQSHLRTQVVGMGQVETDELYVGISKSGAHFVLPVQAKGGKDQLSVVQIGQDLAMCAEKFPNLICRPIAAQFLPHGDIAMFELIEDKQDAVAVVDERHYRLVPPSELSAEELREYARQWDSKRL